MMIDLRESEILKRQMPQAGHGIVRREFPVPDSIKQFSDGFGIQTHPQAANLFELLPRLAFKEKAGWRLESLAR
jgi:hypothetical protein